MCPQEHDIGESTAPLQVFLIVAEDLAGASHYEDLFAQTSDNSPAGLEICQPYLSIVWNAVRRGDEGEWLPLEEHLTIFSIHCRLLTCGGGNNHRGRLSGRSRRGRVCF